MAKAKGKPTILEHAQRIGGEKLGPLKAKKLLAQFHHTHNVIGSIFVAIQCAREIPKVYQKDPDGKYRYLASFLRKVAPKMTAAQMKEYAQLPLTDLLEMLYGC